MYVRVPVQIHTRRQGERGVVKYYYNYVRIVIFVYVVEHYFELGKDVFHLVMLHLFNYVKMC